MYCNVSNIKVFIVFSPGSSVYLLLVVVVCEWVTAPLEFQNTGNSGHTMIITLISNHPDCPNHPNHPDPYQDQDQDQDREKFEKSLFRFQGSVAFLLYPILFVLKLPYNNNTIEFALTCVITISLLPSWDWLSYLHFKHIILQYVLTLYVLLIVFSWTRFFL